MDWNKEWKNARQKNGHSDDVEFWNDFAPRFRKKPAPGETDFYVEEFYRLSGIEPGDTIFDMGSGSGTLAIPFAQKGHEIYAADFSPKMLEVLKADAAELGLSDRIHTIRLDWNEDWSKRDLPVCDVAISSRSLISDDLTGCIKKLQSTASRKVALGVWTTGQYDYDKVIAEAIGYKDLDYGVFVYIMNILFEMNLMPELSYIKGTFKSRKYETFEECVTQNIEKFPRKLTQEQCIKLEAYTREHLVQKDGMWSYDHDGSALWAIIGWNR